MHLTKSDFNKFREAPLHLWAAAHDRLEQSGPTDFQRLLALQGQQVEALALQFLAAQFPGAELRTQVGVEDGRYYARLDALLVDPSNEWCDLYEIKSSTSVKKEHLEDVAFQALVTAARLPLRNVFVVHVNNTYTRAGDLDHAAFFTVEDVTGAVIDLFPAIETARQAAWDVAAQPEPHGIEACNKPKDCPCPGLCFPDLPQDSIYNLPRIGKTAQALRARGILSLADIPNDTRLSAPQELHLRAFLNGEPLVNLQAIQDVLAGLAFPLYFLDYETFNPAVPMFDNYRPYEQIVFQYSLHVLDAPGAPLRHYEFLALENGDPEPPLLASLAQALGPGGTVIVWNKSFEMSRNREMAARLPQYRAFLEDLNARVYDLMEIFSGDLYVDSRFRGSASIKHVLPVLVPDLDYHCLAVQNGEQAMLAWQALFSAEITAEQRAETAECLLAYCHQDTLAMVRIWEFLRAL